MSPSVHAFCFRSCHHLQHDPTPAVVCLGNCHCQMPLESLLQAWQVANTVAVSVCAMMHLRCILYVLSPVPRMLPRQSCILSMQPLIGDILSDLPEISSFTMTENANYKTEPQTPYQQLVRRSPPDCEQSQGRRAEAADGFMKCSHDAKRKQISNALRAADGIQKVRHITKHDIVLLIRHG